jgi:hypothetical protein
MTRFSSLAALLMLAATQAPAQGPVTSLHTLDAALKAAEKLVTRKVTWSGSTKLQKEWQSLRKEVCKDTLPSGWIESFASRDVNEVNAFLKRKGMTIQLPKLQTRQIAAAAVLDAQLTWKAQGRERDLKVGTRRYPGFLLEERTVGFRRVQGHKHPVIEICTATGDKVFVTAWDKAVPTAFELSKTAARMTRQARPDRNHGYIGVHLPKVDLKVQSRLTWLEGLKAGDGTSLGRVLTQTMLKMDHNGLRAKTATAVSWARKIGDPYRMEKSFLLWIVPAKATTYPVFAVHVPTTAWKDPGNVQQ